jgi:LuxR family maltose regulon positive regulatory protein
LSLDQRGVRRKGRTQMDESQKPAAPGGKITGRDTLLATEISYARELEYLVLARLLLKQNQPEHALDLLEGLEALAMAQGRLESALKIWLLQSIGFAAAGKAEQGLKVLARALAQAGPQGYVHTFVDEGRQVASLLHHVLALGLASEYAAGLLAAFPSLDQERRALSSSSAPSFIEPLSQRELEVLELLAGGAFNREIAQQLSIAQTTAKKHVSNIIGKLGVKNRTQAVSRARDLGLL